MSTTARQYPNIEQGPDELAAVHPADRQAPQPRRPMSWLPDPGVVERRVAQYVAAQRYPDLCAHLRRVFGDGPASHEESLAERRRFLHLLAIAGRRDRAANRSAARVVDRHAARLRARARGAGRPAARVARRGGDSGDSDPDEPEPEPALAAGAAA